MKLNFKINLRPAQKEAYKAFHDPNVKELVLNFSRQQGKTTLCEILIIETLCKKKNDVFYISPDFAQGKKVYREILNLLQPTGLITKKNSSDLTIDLFNGSHLGFFSCKNPTAIRGNTCSGLLILDECAYLPEETSDGQNLFHMVIKPITKAKKPKVVYISTPNGKHGIYYEKYLEGLNSETTKTLEYDIYQDSSMSPEEIELLKKDTPPLAWEQEYLVKFLDNALTAFENFEEQFTDYQEDKKISNHESVWIGLDFSANGEDETILSVVNKDNYVRQYLISGSLDQKYKRISDIIDSYKNVVAVYMEANGIGEPMINEVKKLVKNNKSKLHYWVTTNESKNAMVGMLQLLIANKEIWFSNLNKELFKQFGLFAFEINKKTRRITYGAKAPNHDDRIMSLMMALQAKEDYPYSGGSNYSFIRTRPDRI